MDTPRITLHLTGRFRVIGPDGADLTPRGAKPQACLALLATSETLERGRGWIVARLWSDRGAEQARGSLRQAIKTIRRSLGPHADAILAHRNGLGLDPDRVCVQRTGDGEFLEGLEVADDGWLDWLRWERVSQGTPAPTEQTTPTRPDPHLPGQPAPLPASDLQLHLHLPDGDNSVERFVNGTVAEIFAQGLEETFGIETFFSSAPTASPFLQVTSMMQGETGRVALALRRGQSYRRIWSGREAITQNDCNGILSPTLSALVFAGQDALLNDRVNALGAAMVPVDIRLAVIYAVHDALSFEDERLDRAYVTLDQICAQEDHPQALAWYLFVIRALYYEQHRRAGELDMDVVQRRCETALRIAPDNSLILSMVSAIYLRLLGKPHDGTSLAQRAVQMNAASPFAIDAVASAFYLGDQIDKGHQLSRRASSMVQLSRFAPYFQMSQCVGALALGHVEEARKLAVAASAISTRLKSAWRFRLAISAHERDFRAAQQARIALENLEGGDCIENMTENPTYPIPTIRKSILDLRSLRQLARA